MMKLKNKKTGEIGELDFWVKKDDEREIMELIVRTDGDHKDHQILRDNTYKTIKDMLDDWEELNEPVPLEDYWYMDYKNYPRNALYYTKGSLESSATAERKEIGNYFTTREEAEKAVEKLKAWKRLKDKGFKFNGGDDSWISYSFNIVNWDDETEKDFDLLFGGEE